MQVSDFGIGTALVPFGSGRPCVREGPERHTFASKYDSRAGLKSLWGKRSTSSDSH